MDINVLFQIVILIFSVIIHEVSHGSMALFWGDKTALYEGRLTLNPLPHLDWFGSIVLPLFLWITGAGFMIGWAKPVPYNVYNLRNRRVAEPLVALAGPLSNLTLAVIFGLLIRIISVPNIYFSPQLLSNLIDVFSFVVFLNIGLAIFNLLPIPPLDGSKILFSILPIGGRFVFSTWAQRYGLVLIIALFIFFPNLISGLILPIISGLFGLITGLH